MEKLNYLWKLLSTKLEQNENRKHNDKISFIYMYNLIGF